MRTTSDRSSSAPCGRHIRRALVTLALALLLTPISAARGQVLARDERDAARHAAQCRTAARFLETGTPRPRLPWARRTILDCGAEAPAALAAASRRLSASRDTADLNALLRAAQFVRDAGFFEAALEVAGMPDASPEARATGLLVAAMETTDRTDFDLGALLAADGPMLGCVGGHSDHSLRIPGGAPLPADAGARLRAALASVRATPGEPLLVRNAARCASAVLAAQSPRADSTVVPADSLQRLRQAQANCDRAVALLGTLDPLGQVHPHGQGQTPSVEALDFADSWLLVCGAQGGVTAASIIRTLRVSPDTSLLERFVGGFAAFRDSAVFNAAFGVAGDHAASAPARIHAFRTLFVLRTGQFWVGYPEMLAYDEAGPGGPVASCGHGVNRVDTAPSWYNGAPLPADFQQRIRQLANRVFGDTSEPVHVRSASRCAMQGS